MEASSNLPNARPGDIESILPPLFLPKAPERNYFLFGEVLREIHKLLYFEELYQNHLIAISVLNFLL